MMRISPPANFEMAIEMYYGKVELSTADICELFNGCSLSSANKLKKIAKELMQKENRLPWNSGNVLTEVAYRAWNIDIIDLERRMAKLQKLREKAVI